MSLRGNCGLKLHWKAISGQAAPDLLMELKCSPRLLSREEGEGKRGENKVGE